jgi:hypothetical protein
MSNVEIYNAYFQAFEETYKDDDWNRITPYFASDMRYNNAEGQTLTSGAAAVQYLQTAVDALDRRFDSRAFDGEPAITGDGDTVTLVFKVRYKIEGAPDLVICGKEVATFKEGKIQHMDDLFEDASLAEFASWMQKHAGLLD